MIKKRGISRTYWQFSLSLILLLGIFLGAIYVLSEYISYGERVKEMERNYYENHKDILVENIGGLFEHFQLINNFETSEGHSAQDIRQALLRHVQESHFHENGVYFILDRDGALLVHADKNLIGKNLFQASVPKNGIRQDELMSLAESDEGVFFEHYWKERQHRKPVLKLVYMKAYKPLGLLVGAEISLDKALDLEAKGRRELSRIVFLRVLLILSIMALIIIISSVGFYMFASRMRREFSLFFSFFRHDPMSNSDIDPSKFTFFETALLAQHANSMNRDIREKTGKLNDEILQRKQAQEELIKLSQAVEQSPAVVIITDLNGVIEYVNPKFTEVTGYMPSEAIGSNPRIIRSGFQSEGFYREFWETLQAGKDWKGEFHNKKKNGEMYWESALVTCIRNTEGKITHYLKVSDDISERKRLEQNMEYLAHHDTLTGLPNRLLFSDRLNHAIARARRGGKKVAVLILDLDNFKQVNDTLGHDAGDALLNMVVTRFMKHLREEDTASRMGGDEFNFLISDLSGTEGLHKVLDRMLASFGEPFIIKDTPLNITPSIGVSLYPEDGDDLETLVKKADIALYQVKGSGKNNYRFYDGKDGPISPGVGT